jgi:chromate reductase, NAD(P)H dehydrogenase (quinone)
MKNILATNGSTRINSTNHRFILATEKMFNDDVTVYISHSIEYLPHFNADLQGGETPNKVLHIKRQMRQADAIIICTPEYAHGVTGSLKNCIDWTLATCELSNKPIMLITAIPMANTCIHNL